MNETIDGVFEIKFKRTQSFLFYNEIKIDSFDSGDILFVSKRRPLSIYQQH